MSTPPRSLPRRANTIRALSAALALRKTSEISLRQVVSDRISYGLSILLGATVFRYAGWWAAYALAAMYAMASYVAWRRYRVIKRLNEEHPA